MLVRQSDKVIIELRRANKVGKLTGQTKTIKTRGPIRSSQSTAAVLFG